MGTMAGDVSHITFDARDATLPGVLWRRSERQAPGLGVIVMHPHPMMGGDMDNNVVVACCEGLRANVRVTATLRFNFRKQENPNTGDVAGALVALRAQSNVDSVAFIGYSYGAVAG